MEPLTSKPLTSKPLSSKQGAEDEEAELAERLAEAEAKAEALEQQNHRLGAPERDPLPKVSRAARSTYRAVDPSLEIERALDVANERVVDLMVERSIIEAAKAKKREALLASFLLIFKLGLLMTIPAAIGIATDSFKLALAATALIAIVVSLAWLYGLLKPNGHRASGRI